MSEGSDIFRGSWERRLAGTAEQTGVKVLHLGQGAAKSTVKDLCAWGAPCCRAPGVLAEDKLSMSQQRATGALKANQLLGCICRGISRSIEI